MAKPSERCKTIIRTWEILNLLEQRAASASEIAGAVGDCGVTVRTVYRDLHALEAAGFALYTERDEDGAVRWRLLRKGVTPARTAA